MGSKDEEYQQLIQTIQNGFPKKGQHTGKLITPYWKIRDELAVDGEIVIFGSRIVVPIAMRKEVLGKLHTSHQGIVRTQRRARQAVYWPGINSDITNMIESCKVCQEHLPSIAPGPILIEAIPSRVFEDISVDLFSHQNNHYMICVD